MLLIDQTMQLMELEVVMKNLNVTKMRVRFPRIGRIRVILPFDQKLGSSARFSVSMIKDGLYEELHMITTSNVEWICHRRIIKKLFQVRNMVILFYILDKIIKSVP